MSVCPTNTQKYIDVDKSTIKSNTIKSNTIVSNTTEITSFESNSIKSSTIKSHTIEQRKIIKTNNNNNEMYPIYTRFNVSANTTSIFNSELICKNCTIKLNSTDILYIFKSELVCYSCQTILFKNACF